MKKFLQEFKAFALRGNVMDMAIGVIIAGAFSGIVTSLTENFINPILSLVTTQALPEGFTWGAGVAAFLTTIVNFIITALVLFMLLKAMNKMMTIGKKPEAPKAPTTKVCPYCQSEISIKATRCPHCTSELGK